MDDKVDLSVIVITLNNASVIEASDRQLSTVLAQLGLKAELIYVDSGSQDETVYRLQRCLADKTVPKQVIELRRNFGQASAFAAGLNYSKGNFILTIDPTLSVDPMEIGEMVNEIEKGYDLVNGARQRPHDNLFVRTRSRWANLLTSGILGVPLRDYGTKLRIVRREFLEDLPLYGELFAFIPAFVFASGARIREIPVMFHSDRYTTPEYTPIRYITSFFDVIVVWFLIHYSYRPMHIFGILSLIFIIISFAIIFGAIFYARVTQSSLIQTPLPVLAGILLAIGIIIFLLGLTTELVIRSYYSVKDRVPYSVRNHS